jgi:hypothetical protein
MDNRTQGVWNLFQRQYSRRLALAVICGLIAGLICDLLISNLSFSGVTVSSLSGIIGYIALSALFVIGWYIAINFGSKLNQEIIKRSTLFNRLSKVMIIVASVSAAVLVSIIIMMIITAQYPPFLLTFAVGLSYIVAIFSLCLLASRFLSWYKSSKSFVILLYGISALTLGIRVLTALTLYSSLLGGIVGERTEESPVVLLEIEPTSTMGWLLSAYSISSIVATMMIWISTSLLLYSYINRLGYIKYGLLVAALPLYFLSDFIIDTPAIAESFGLDEIAWSIFLTFQGVVGGILFGLPFIVMARYALRSSRTVGNFLIIAAIGIVTFSISFSAIIDHAPYPPFGIHNILSVGLASYLILLGLYSSAISIAWDAGLRKNIRNSADDLKLLDNIARAEVESETAKKVRKIAKEQSEHMTATTGIPFDLSEDDVNQYVHDVVDELKRHGRTRGTTSET